MYGLNIILIGSECEDNDVRCAIYEAKCNETDIKSYCPKTCGTCDEKGNN